MPSYNLEALDGGTVTLRSGEWRWFPVRLNAMPERSCVSQHLFFASVEHKGSVMRTRIDPDTDHVSEREVEEAAANPDEREAWTATGQATVWPPREDVDDPEWRIRVPHRGYVRTDMHREHRLGDLTHEEVGDLLRVLG